MAKKQVVNKAPELTGEEKRLADIKIKLEMVKAKFPNNKIIYFYIKDDYDNQIYNYFITRPSKSIMDAYYKDAEDNKDIAFKSMANEIIIDGNVDILKGDDILLYDALVNAITETFGTVRHQTVKL